MCPGTIMESSINSSAESDTNIAELLDDIFSDVPLVATYSKILLSLVILPIIITPAAAIVHIIRKTEELHTKYCLFLVNLLISDILTTIQYCFEIFIMVLFLLDIRIHVSVITHAIISMPQVVTRYSFVLLAIDRVVGVAFPYRYRSIMKPEVVYALIASLWIIAAVLLFVSKVIVSSYLIWSFGVFIPQSFHPILLILHVLPQVVSAVLIVGTNVYLYRSIIKSKKKLENNLKLSGKDDHKVTRPQRLIRNLQMQLESSLPVFMLGGVDCLLNVLRVVIIVVLVVYCSDVTVRLYFFQFIVYPLEYCQIIFHSITYGVYKKAVRKNYQRLQRLFPLRPSKVVILHSQYSLILFSLCFILKVYMHIYIRRYI